MKIRVNGIEAKSFAELAEPKESVYTDALLSVKDLAERLNVSTQTVYKLATRGDIPSIRVGSVYRFSSANVESWIQSRS
jgi:excisionase family DNA binding protein